MTAPASTSYLQSFVDNVSELPIALKRNFAVMRELDEKSHVLRGEIQAVAREKLAALRAGTAELEALAPGKRARGRGTAVLDTALGDEAEAKIQQLLQFEDEKVALASQVYDNVDTHIRRLDDDLTALKAELQKERDAADPLAGGKDSKRSHKRKHPGQVAIQDANAAVAAAMGAAANDPAAPLPLPELTAGHVFDSNEPVYCYCQRVSFGEMIGCDNEDCPIEWFHYGCVGVSPDNVPQEWYCKDCQALKDAGKI
mmetsp:Transcript_164/g.438  ORF Transcript_164/g.438 Transcript_164/m.438 type:complete len:256 (+) Transcript_164:352-1119(+)|eukprot:jgi/Tetstr1/442524/TSEL_030622.t1